MTSKKVKVNTLLTADELSNEQYHSLHGWYSSSQFKEALTDIETFHKLYVTKELTKDVSPQLQSAFNVGTYFHTAVLEPDKLDEECHIFDGIRRGKAWDLCQEENQGKVIITAKEAEKAHKMIEACSKNSEMQKILKSGSPEVSAFAEIEGVKVRVRADWIDFDRGFIMDLKSTTGNVKDILGIQKKVDNLDYDLSASLYLDAFNSVLKSKGMPLIKDWYWGFASKDTVNSKIYRARVDSPMIKIGRKKYLKGLEEIRKAQENGWKFEDTISDLEPIIFAKQEWLEGEDSKKSFQSRKVQAKLSKDEDLL